MNKVNYIELINGIDTRIKKLEGSLKTLNTQYSKTIELSKQLQKQKVQKTGDGAELKKLTEQTNKLATANTNLTEIQKRKLKTENELKAASKDYQRIQKAQITTEGKLLAGRTKSNAQLEKSKLAVKKQTQETRNLVKWQKAAKGSIDKLAAANSILEKRLKGVNQTTAKGKRQADLLRKAIDRNTASMKRMSSAATRQKMNIGNYLVAAYAKLAIGVMAAMAVIRRMQRVIVENAKKNIEFQKANSKLASILGVTKREMRGLRVEAKKYGSTTAFTASQVTSLQIELAKLGFKQKEIKNSTKGILDLSAATGTELAESAALAGSTLRAFGLDASEMGRVTDVMASSTSKSALDMQKLKDSLSKVAPVAKSAGVSLEETIAMLGKLTDNGVEASTAGTGLRNVFLELAKQGLTFDEAMEQINISTDKNKTSLDLFGKRGAVVGQILASTGKETAILTKELEKAGGTAQRMADQQLDNFAGSVTKMKSAWEGFILILWKGNGFLRKAVDGFTKFFGILKDINKENLSDEIRKEKIELNRLVGAVTNANNTQESRNRLINELQKEYPDFIKNIDIETVSNETLKKMLDEVNIAYDKKIEQMVKSELIAEGAKKLIKLQLKEVEIIGKIDIEQNKLNRAYELKAKSQDKSQKLTKKERLEYAKLLINLTELETEIYNYNTILEGNRIEQKEISTENQKQLKILDDLIEKNSDLVKTKKEEETALETELRLKRELAAVEAIKAEETRKAQEELFKIRKKYGLLTNFELYEADVKAFTESEDFKLLSAKETIKVLKGIYDKYFEKQKENTEELTILKKLHIEDDTEVIQASIDEETEFEIASEIAKQDELTRIEQEAINERDELRKAARDAAFQITKDIINGAFDLQKIGRDKDMAAELEALEKKGYDQETFDKKRAKIEKKYAKLNYDASLKQAYINMALSIGKAFATIAYPFSLIVAALVATSSLIQIAKIKKAGYKKGIVGIKGAGTETSDDIDIKISKDESVITAKGTKRAKKTLERLNKDASKSELIDSLLSDLNISNMVLPNPANFDNIVINDYLKLEKVQIENNKLLKELVDIEKDKPVIIQTERGTEVVYKNKTYINAR